jgi:hypothetical protein
MRHIATFAVSLTGLVLLICPVAGADPSLSPQDYNFGKYLAQAGVSKEDARTIGQAAVNSYCPAHSQLSFS